MSAHINTYTYIHTHIQNVHMNERMHAWNDGAAAKRARSRCRERKLCRSLSFDAIKLHFAPPIQILPSHFTHFLKHQYPSTPHPLFPTYPRTVRGLRASELLLFYTHQMNRVHSSEEAPRSLTMAPCVVAERQWSSSQWPHTSADERDVVWAPRCRDCVWAVAGFGRSSLTSRFFVNSHLDHSRAWIPACSLTFPSNLSTTTQGADPPSS